MTTAGTIDAVPGGNSVQAPAPGREPKRSGPLASFLSGYLPLILATLIIALPLIWMVLASFKTPAEISTQRLQIFPNSFRPTNYIDASTSVPFPRLFLNSFIVTAAGSIIKVLLATFTAYALVYVRFPFKNVIFMGILVALMVPPQVAILPNYVLVSGLGGQNTYWGILLPGLGTAFGTFLLRQHFLSLPYALMEAAELDGASHWKRLTRIVMPVSMPTIATVGLVTIVNEWNDYIWPLVITNKAEMMTLPVGLTLLQNSENQAGSYGILMAGTVMVIVPVLIVFALLQRYIVAGLTQGAVTS